MSYAADQGVEEPIVPLNTKLILQNNEPLKSKEGKKGNEIK